MTENKSIQLVKAAKELNVGIHTLVDHLAEKGQVVENKPTTKLSPEQYNLLLSAFKQDLAIKKKAEEINIGKIRKDKADEIKEESVVIERSRIIVEGPKVVGKMDLDAKRPIAESKAVEPIAVPEAPKAEKTVEKQEQPKPETLKAETVKSEPVHAESEKTEPKKVEPAKTESPIIEAVVVPKIERQHVEKPALKVVDKIDLSPKKHTVNKKPAPAPHAKKEAPKKRHRNM
jgi:translation initiation factor IF-2